MDYDTRFITYEPPGSSNRFTENKICQFYFTRLSIDNVSIVKTNMYRITIYFMI